jgi:hypothetical protein
MKPHQNHRKYHEGEKINDWSKKIDLGEKRQATGNPGYTTGDNPYTISSQAIVIVFL